MRFHGHVLEGLGTRRVRMMYETNKPGNMLINHRGRRDFHPTFTNDSACIAPIPLVAYYSVSKLSQK